MTLDSRFPALRRQHGNTLTGLIIGLVIGLLIAVVVALVITKGASPFTDKSGKQGKAADPTMGQVADPNKPMYGSKDAAREANKTFQRATPADGADPLAGAVAGIKDAAADAAKPAAPAPAADPARPAAKPDAPAAADDSVVYFLQAGAFREMADAENTRAKLALLGFEATISERASDTGVLHRVRLGPYNQVEAMNKVRSKLSENGIDVAVVRNQK